MQGKALVTALLVFLCLLVGCGGGGGEQSSSASQGAESPGAPQSGKEAAAQLQQSAEQIKREREGQAKQGTPAAQKPPAGGSSASQGEQAPAQPPAQPASTHHDSGGGTAQFATKQGDNSIQETGHEGSAAETQAAAAVLHAYLDARVAQRWSDACFYLSAGFAATIEAFAERYAKDKEVKGCDEVLEALAGGSSQQALVATARADVGALRVEGERGFLLYHGPGSAPYAMPMVREGADWKVGSLEGAPLG